MSDDEKPDAVRIAAAPSADPRPGPKYVFPGEADVGPVSPPKTLPGADLRNASIKRIIRELETLEKTLKDGDPVQSAIVTARRKIATYLTPGAPGGGAGLRVVK
jgi:hypothetical protein